MTSPLARFCSLGVRRGHSRIGSQHIVDALHELHHSLNKSNFTGLGRAVLVMALVVGIVQTLG